MPLPALTNLNPAVGPSSGGTPVTITGTGFTDTAHTTVLFGPAPASSVAVVSATQITTVSPPYPAGGVGADVTVKNQNGTSAIVAADIFSYYPTLTSITDINGNPITEAQTGDTILINGSGFGTPGSTIPFAGGMVLGATMNVFFNPTELPAGSGYPGAATNFRAAFSNTQITMIAPAVAPGSYWICVDVTSWVPDPGNPGGLGGDTWPISNSLAFEIVDLPPAPAPVVDNITDNAGNLLSVSVSGSVYITNQLNAGETIVLNGTNFGDATGGLVYLMYLEAPPGSAIGAGTGNWGDFTIDCTILDWSDTAITLQLLDSFLGINGVSSFEIKVTSANSATNSGSWGNAIYLAYDGPEDFPFPAITSVTDPSGNAITQAVVDTYIMIVGSNFGSAPGTVEWWTPSPSGDLSLGTLIASTAPRQSSWSDTKIAALTPIPVQVLQGQTQPPAAQQNNFFIRVIDAQGNPSSSIEPGSQDYLQDAYSFTLVPPPFNIYVVNAADNSVIFIDGTTLVLGQPIPLAQGPITPYTVSSPLLASSFLEPIAIPMGMAINSTGTRIYVSIQIWTPQQSGSASEAITWGGVVSLTPGNGFVAVIQADPTQSNYNGVEGYYPVGINPQGIAVVNAPTATNTLAELVYVANTGSPVGDIFPGNGNISVINTALALPSLNPLAATGGSQAAVSTIPSGQTANPAVGAGNAVPGLQSPLVLQTSPDGNRLYVLDGGQLYNTQVSNSRNYVSVIDINSASSTFNQIVSTIAIPGLDFQAQDMVLSPDGTRLYIATQQAGTGQNETDEYHSIAVIDTTQISPGTNELNSAAVFGTATLEIPNATTGQNPEGPANSPSTTTTASIRLAPPGSNYNISVANAAVFEQDDYVFILDSNLNWIWGQIANITAGANQMVIMEEQQSANSGVVASGALVSYAPTQPDISTGLQQIGINNSGQPTFNGLYVDVLAEGVSLSPDGRYLYVSDLFGPVWIIDTTQMPAPGNYNPPSWLMNLLSEVPTVTGLGFGGPFSTNVVAAMNVQGEPNAMAVAPNGLVYVAEGGISASSHEVIINARLESGQDIIPAPANQVAVFMPTPSGGYNIPAPQASPPPGVPPLLANIAVGNYPLAIAVAQPFPPVPPPPPLNPGSDPLFRNPWFPSWIQRSWPIFPLQQGPQVSTGKNPGGGDFFNPVSVPDWAVTRIQFASVLQQVFALAAPATRVYFADVPRGFWGYYTAQATANLFKCPLQSGGRPVFLPNLPIDRQEAAAIIESLLRTKGNLPAIPGKDARDLLKSVKDNGDIVKALQSPIAAMLKYSILSPLPDGRFYPSQSLRRSELNQAVTMLKELLKEK